MAANWTDEGNPVTPVLVQAAHESDTVRRRTLVLATERLLLSGTVPTLPEAARAAGVGLDVIERLFAGPASLLLEAALLQGLPEFDEAFGDAPDSAGSAAVGDRVERVALLLHRHIQARASALPFSVLERLIELALEVADASGTGSVADVPLIDAAIRPIGDSLSAMSVNRLRESLTLLILAQTLIAARSADDLQRRRSLGDLGWACRALVRGALAQQATVG